MESSQKQTFWQTIALFHDVGVLEHIVVVGSWAEYLYQESGVIPGFRWTAAKYSVTENKPGSGSRINPAGLSDDAG